MCLYGLRNLDTDKDREIFREKYTQASIAAFRVVVWVEIGFQGLDNLIEHPASLNWSQIRATGKEMYVNQLRDFVRFRDQNQITEDIFTRYRVEYLLDRFQRLLGEN